MNHSNTRKIRSIEKALPGFAWELLRFNKYYRLFPFFINTFYNQIRGLSIRARNKKDGLHVPTVLCLSVTSKCNLNCIGCYYKSQKRQIKEDLSDDEIRRIIREAHDLGIRDLLILGGEPFMRDIFELTSGYDDILFFVYTNSTLIDENIILKLKKRHNIIPFLSLEGYSETDKRRGAGILDNIKHVSRLLQKNKIMYGLSYTVTKNNFDEIIQDDFVKNDIKSGALCFTFLEYMPLNADTFDLMLTKEQKVKFVKFMTNFKVTYKANVLSQILETVSHGGCVAGKDVAHISSDGQLEPCPFVAYSDSSVREMSLEKALRSRFLSAIRDQLHSLEERPEHSCKLFVHKDWINKTLEEGKLRNVIEENVGT
jgi:MoaA/NifB/PqqE/SkfB family radical SAM enzyme